MALMTMSSSAHDLFAEFGSIRGSDDFGSTSTEKFGKHDVKAPNTHTVSEMDLFTCSNCQESTLCEDEGVLVCTSCGLESGSVITSQQEWRNHSDSGKGDPSLRRRMERLGQVGIQADGLYQDIGHLPFLFKIGAARI